MADEKEEEKEEKLYREYDDPVAFKRLGKGFNEREQWRRRQKERLRLTERMGLVPLNLGAPALDNDLDKIRQAKERNPTYSSREIYENILNQSVPLYKFKDIYSVDDLSSRFSVDELERLKTTYREQRVPHYEFFEYMDKLIKYAKEKRAHRARLAAAREAEEAAAREEEERQQLALLKPNTRKCPGPKCSILGGKLKNIFRNKNKSNKSKSKRVDKRVKKNKRYSRKIRKNC
jgi:hypothetical protein